MKVIYIVIFLLLTTSVMATKPTMDPMIRHASRCCNEYHQGDPIKFRLSYYNFGVGSAESFKDAPIINITAPNGCCNYVPDRERCHKCIIASRDLVQEPQMHTRMQDPTFLLILLVSALIIIFWIILLVKHLTKQKQK